MRLTSSVSGTTLPTRATPRCSELAETCIYPIYNVFGSSCGTDSFRKRDKNLMSMKTKAITLATSFAVLLFCCRRSHSAAFTPLRTTGLASVSSRVPVKWSLMRWAVEYVEELNITAVMDGALHGLLEPFDSNSSYMTADVGGAAQGSQERSQGHISALHSPSVAWLHADVVSVLPGSP